MNIRPLNDVLIVEVEKTTETESGIQLPNAYKDPAGTEIGKVIAVNSSFVNMESGVRFYVDVNAGQKVLFLRKHGVAVKGHKMLQTVRYANLLAIIEE